MFDLPDDAKIIFYSKPISQLNGIDGLTSVIQNEMDMEPDSGHYYLFCNSKRDRFKVLYKDGDNLAIWFKRFKGTLGFSYTNRIVTFDKSGFFAFLEKTSSKHHYTLKNLFK
jgi:IS66 Orf2 like protein